MSSDQESEHSQPGGSRPTRSSNHYGRVDRGGRDRGGRGRWGGDDSWHNPRSQWIFTDDWENPSPQNDEYNTRIYEANSWENGQNRFGRRRGSRRGSNIIRRPMMRGRGRLQQDHIKEVTMIKRHRLITNKYQRNVQSSEKKEWEELPLPILLLEELKMNRHMSPSNIQVLAIENALKNPYEHCLIEDFDSSGKTTAFVLASLARVDSSNPELQIIVISPNYLLSQQTVQKYNMFATCLSITVNLLTNNNKFQGQVAVTTEKVFTNSLRRQAFSMEHLKMLIIDEADLLLNKEFNPQSYDNLKHILLHELPTSVQYILVSALFPENVLADIGKIITEFCEISIKTDQLMRDAISHYYILCSQDKKIDIFNEIIRTREEGICVGFLNSSDFAQTVYNITQKRGHRSVLIMEENMKVEERECSIRDINEGMYSIIIAKEFCGIDNTMIRTIVNFDLTHQKRSRAIDFNLYLRRSRICSPLGRHGVIINMITHEDELGQLIGLSNYYGFNLTPLESIDDLIECERRKYEEEEFL